MNFDINEVSIFEIDNVLEGQDLSQYDLEIEQVVDNLWSGIGEFEDILLPFFTIHLKNELLPSLYINYLSLIKLESKYETISAKVSTSIIDIIAKKLKIKLDPNRINYDHVFGLKRSYFFTSNPMLKRPLWKRILSRIKNIAIVKWSIFRGVNVLYMNAGKLKEDFSLIPNSLNAIHIKKNNSSAVKQDIDKIKNVIKNNIERMDLSIPSDLIIEVIDQNIFSYLCHTFNHISSLVEFIKVQKIRLVISSAINNELFLCLLAAARISKIESMVVSHGMPTVFNKKINSYCTFQCTLSDFEHQYYDTKQFQFKAKWFG
tara:strand:- start:2988 stop:3938 length:951 start_codon:yes stop_codon:yes gene_type:complete